MIKIRKARTKDLPAIHDMAEVVFRQTYKDIISPEQMEYMMEMMYSMPNLEKQLEEGHHYYLAWYDDAVSEKSGAGNPPADMNRWPCGYVSVQHEGPNSSDIEIFHLHKIYVMPDMQGKGIGQKLFDATISHVKATVPGKPARIELNVNKHNKAVSFYKHLGLRILLEEDFPIGNGFYKTDYIMGLDI